MAWNVRGTVLGLAGIAVVASGCGDGHHGAHEAPPATAQAAPAAEAPRPVTDKTLDDVLALHLADLGGADKLAAIASVRLRGSIEEQGGPTFTVTVEKKRPLLYSRRMEAGGSVRTLGFDGKAGWMVEGQGETAAVHDMPEPVAKSLQRHFAIEDPLVDPAERGLAAKLLGATTIDGADAYVVEVQLQDGQTATFYVDAKSGRLVKSIEVLHGAKGPTRAEVTYGDVREVGGVRWSFHQDIAMADGAKQTLSWSEIEVNPKLDDATFVRPAGAK